MAKESKGKHSKLKASEDVGTAVTQTSQKSLEKKILNQQPKRISWPPLVRILHSRNDDDDSEEDEASRIKRALKRDEDEFLKEMEGEANDKKPQEKGKRRKKD